MELGKLMKLSTGNKTTIPKELTDKLGWTPGNFLDAKIEGRSIVLRKVVIEKAD